MALAAAQVVDALVTRLGGVVATAGRVYPSRNWPLATTDLPAWRVFITGEDCEQLDMDGQLHHHRLTVACRAYTQATADLDDAINALAAAGLTALFAPPAPYALRLASIERAMAAEGEAKLGTVTLLVGAEFIASAAAPETILS